MSAQSFFETVVALTHAQFLGPRYAFDAPSFHAVCVKTVDREPPNPGHPQGVLVVKGTAYRPVSWEWTMKIDVAARVIDDASWHVLTPKHSDYDKWGFIVLFVGFPGIVVCSPVLLPWFGARWALQRLSGLDVHQAALWLKLRGQLPADSRELVVAALRNHNTSRPWTYRAGLQKQLEAEARG